MSQEKKMDIKDWKKAMGEVIQFPFEISNLNIKQLIMK